MHIKNVKQKIIVTLSCLLISNAACAGVFRWMTPHGGAPTPAVGFNPNGFNYAGWDGPWINRQNLPSTGGGNSYELGVGSYNGYRVTKSSVTVFGTGSIVRNHWVPHHANGFNVSWDGPIENYGYWAIKTRNFTYAGGRMRHRGSSAQINLSAGGGFVNNSLFELVNGSSITGDSSLTFTNNNTVGIYNSTASCQVRLQNNGSITLFSGNFTLSTGFSAQGSGGRINILSGRTFTLNARLDNSGIIDVRSGGTLRATGTLGNDIILRNLSGGYIAVNGTFNRNGPLHNISGASTALIEVGSGGNITFPNTPSYLSNQGYIKINGGTAAFPTVSYGNTGYIELNGALGGVTGTIRGTGAAQLLLGESSACTGTLAATIDIPDMFVRNSSGNPTFSGTVTVTDLLQIQSGSTATFDNHISLGTALIVDSGCTFNRTGTMYDLTSTGTVNFTNSGTVNDSAGLFAPTFFTNRGTAIFTNTNFNPSLTANYATLEINGTTPINGNIITYDNGSLTLGGTTHVIGAGSTITHGANYLTWLTIAAPTTCNGSIINNSTFSVQSTLTNGTITNNSYTSLSGNLDGTGTFTNTSTVEQFSGNVSKAVSNQSAWYLRDSSSPEISSTSFVNESTGSLFIYPNTTVSGTITNYGGIAFISGDSTFTGNIIAQTGSFITIEAPLKLVLGTITGDASNTSSALFINSQTSGEQSTGALITDVRTIGVYNGVFNINNNITGVSDQLRIDNSAVTVNVAAQLGGGSGRIINYGTLNFNGSSSLTNFDNLFKYAGSLTTFNGGGTFSINGTNIVGQPVTGAGTMRVTNATTLQTNAAITSVQTIDITDNSNLTLQNGASCTNFTNINLASGSTIQVDNGASLTVSDSRTLSGDGNIINSGFFTVDNSNLTLGTGGAGGNFTNNSTGVFYVNGTPTITFAGAEFTNNGSILASFSTLNTLPSIDASSVTTVSLSNGTIVVGYNNNFIAEGEYNLFTSNATLTPSTLGGYVLPQPSRYISSWSLSTSGPDVNVQVVRNGFGNHATTARGQAIGDYMELLGRSNPTQEQLNLLNALEKIDNDSDLNTALVNLFPPESPPIQTMQMISTNLRQVEIRLVNTRQDTLMAAAGDNDMYGKHGVWIRPFTSSGHQRDKQDMLGYKAKTKGIAFGIDTEAQHWLTVGIAGSVSKSTVTQNNNALTYTDISAYQAMVYGTVKSANDAYVDWILAVGNNNYDGVRNVTLPGFQADAVSDYGGQQATAKIIASRDFELFDYYQLTPHGSAQYSFLRTLGYQENGAGPFNVNVSPNNMNLFRLGFGAELSVPLSDRNYVGIPAIHAGAYVDAGGGAQDTNSMFISGGPIISSTLQPNRLLIKIGASFNLSISDNVEITANYDLESRRGYTGHEAYLNLRYIF